jgi:hypothetical protein
MPIAEKQSAFLFSSASETIIPYGGLSSNGKPSAVCRFIEYPCSKPCFYPPISERRCYYAVFDPHYFSPEPSQDPYQPLRLKDGDC